MRNKKLFMLFGSILIISLCFLWHFSSSVSFNVNLWDNRRILPGNKIENKISPIHFKNKWNDFWWFIYFGQHLWSGFVVEWIWWTWYECDAQAYWFYYNAQRWDRLWPLDKDTAEKWWMTTVDPDILSGEIYTKCRLSGYNDEFKGCREETNEDAREQCEAEVNEKFSDQHGYFWKIEHVYSWQTMWLVMWTEYANVSWRVIATWWLDLSLIRIDNKYPVWFIYDYVWWAWFVWCSVNGDMKDVLSQYVYNRDRNKIFELNDTLTGVKVKETTYPADLFSCEKVWSAKDTLLSIVVDWIVWMWKNTKNDGYTWNPSNEKTQLFSSVDVNNTQLINYARQKAEILCRGKWNKSDSSDKVVCISTDPSGEVSAVWYAWRTLIVKGLNVVVKPSDGAVYDVFVDGWNLIIEEGDDVQYVIKNNWFISENESHNSPSWFFPYSRLVQFMTLDEICPFRVDLQHDPHFWGYCTDFADDLQDMCLAADFNDDWIFNTTELGKLVNICTNGWEVGDMPEVSVASVIKWNYIINWSVMWDDGEALKNKYFIYWKFTTRDTFSDLEKVFTWRCSRWKDINGKPCLQFDWNPYSNSALAIIDQDYASPLFN